MLAITNDIKKQNIIFTFNLILKLFFCTMSWTYKSIFFLIIDSVHKIPKTKISKTIATFIAPAKSPYPNQLLNIPKLKVSIPKYKTVP